MLVAAGGESVAVAGGGPEVLVGAGVFVGPSVRVGPSVLVGPGVGPCGPQTLSEIEHVPQPGNSMSNVRL